MRGDRALSSEGYRPLLAAMWSPRSVGRVSPMDVVLSPLEEQNRWQLRVDTRHPVFFDHPLDHVPGMLLLEAARQATARVLGCSSPVPSSIAGEFKRYVELDSPCTVEAHCLPPQVPGGEEVVLVTGHQDGALAFSATVTASSHAN